MSVVKIGGKKRWNAGTFGIAAFACLIAATGCSSSTPAASSAPPITVNSRATAASALLLMTQADVQAVDGLGGVTASEIKDVPLDQNPDQRGPCGAVVPQAPTIGATGRDFTATSAEVIELISADGAGQEAFLSALQADHHEGCGNYTGVTKACLLYTSPSPRD